MVSKGVKQKVLIALGVVAVIGALLAVAFSGGNWELLKHLILEDMSNEELKQQLMSFGWRGYVVAGALAALQVVCTFLPAEPVQVLAGITFSFPVALLCCMLGVLCGNTVIFALQKLFGQRLRSFFVKKLNLDLASIARSSKATIIIFILYFLPAIPYGMICFVAASLGMSYRRFIVVTGLGSLPSVVIGVGLGYMAIATSWVVTACLFAVLLLVAGIVFFKKDALFTRLNRYAQQNTGNKVQKPNPLFMDGLYFGARAFLWLRGVRVKTQNLAGEIEKPAIVLCNHGSFIDFIYATALLRKARPSFIVARLYFYNTFLRFLLRKVGAFPKSMFATDLENAKNCLSVLKNGGLLAMMPEARLSTAGKFEDIQGATYSFLKKAGVPIYIVKIQGAYLADPKWGKGFRRGSVVEAKLTRLYTAQEVETLSREALIQGVEAALSYDEYQYLAERPTLRYRSRRMAEGLENILRLCPVCGGVHTLYTKKDTLFCRSCGRLTGLSNRYAFDPGFAFENIGQWYDYQAAKMAAELAENPDFALSCPVELRLRGKGKGLTRSAGQGHCRFDRQGLRYEGTMDGKETVLEFPLEKIYRLLFGAGENFELYVGSDIYYFRPERREMAVDFYIMSKILCKEK